MIYINDNLYLQNFAEIISGARITLRPSSDIPSLVVDPYSGSQTSAIIEVHNSSGGDLFKIKANPLIEFYADERHYNTANVIYNNYATRIVSGYYVGPLLGSASLSGNLDAKSFKIANLALGTAGGDSANMNNVNAAISGFFLTLITLGDIFTQYLVTTPEAERNKIIPTDNHECLILNGFESTTQSDVFSVYDQNRGSQTFRITNDGDCVGNSFSSTNISNFLAGAQFNSQRLTSLGSAIAATDAANLGQVNAAASGLLNGATFKTPVLSGQVGDYFWGPQFGIYTAANPVNWSYLAIDNYTNASVEYMASDIFPFICNRKSKAKEVAAYCSSFAAASGWMVLLVKNGVTCGKLNIGSIPSYPSTTVVSGFWSPLAGQNLDFNPGDRIGAVASGFNANALIAIISTGWETR